MKLWGALSVIVAAWLGASVIHRESHAPWRCDEDCPRWLSA